MEQSSNSLVNSTYFQDQILAKTILDSGVVIPEVPASLVITARDNDEGLLNLTNILGLSEPNKDRILRVLQFIGKLRNDFNVYDLLSDDALEHLLLKLDTKSLFNLCEVNFNVNQFCNSDIGLYTIRRRVREITGFNTSRFNLQRLKFLSEIHLHDKCLRLRILRDRYSFIARRGRLYVFDTKNMFIGNPIQISNVKKVTGQNINLALTEDGIVYIDRYPKPNFFEAYFQGGLFKPIPKSDFDDNKIVDILSFSETCCFLTESGLVYILGKNHADELGLSSTDYPFLTKPMLIPMLKDITSFTVSGGNLCFVNKDGSVQKSSTYGVVLAKKWILKLHSVVFMEGILSIDRDGNVYKKDERVKGWSNTARISASRGKIASITFDGDLYLDGRHWSPDVEGGSFLNINHIQIVGLPPIVNISNFQHEDNLLIMDKNEDVYLLTMSERDGDLVIIPGKLFARITKLQLPG